MGVPSDMASELMCRELYEKFHAHFGISFMSFLLTRGSNVGCEQFLGIDGTQSYPIVSAVNILSANEGDDSCKTLIKWQMRNEDETTAVQLHALLVQQQWGAQSRTVGLGQVQTSTFTT